jgi:hypothetical protein
VDALPVAAGADVLQVEALLVRVRLAELAGDEHVLARLVPEVVVELRVRAAVLPAALDLEGLRVEVEEAAGAVALGVAEHRNDDVVAGHAVDGVRACEPGLADHVLGLDHLLDVGPFRVVGHVDDVDPRRAESRHDQMRAIRAVTRRRAAVPAEVVQLVADVRQRHLVDHAPLLGVDDREEVGLLDTGALVQRGEVEELLLRRLHGLLRRAVEARRPFVSLMHSRSPLRCVDANEATSGRSPRHRGALPIFGSYTGARYLCC